MVGMGPGPLRLVPTLMPAADGQQVMKSTWSSHAQDLAGQYERFWQKEAIYGGESDSTLPADAYASLNDWANKRSFICSMLMTATKDEDALLSTILLPPVKLLPPPKTPLLPPI